jgi:hypothetical protein
MKHQIDTTSTVPFIDCELLAVHGLFTLPECLQESALPAFVTTLQRNVKMLVFNQYLGVPSFAAFVIPQVHKCVLVSLFGNLLEQLPGSYSFSFLY